jgi:hypothetical protein
MLSKCLEETNGISCWTCRLQSNRSSGRPRKKRGDYMEPIQIFDGKTMSNATAADFCAILTEEMHSLYMLAFLLTADNHKAEHCFVGGLGDCVEEIGIFVERMSSWARRSILEQAIRMILPSPQDSDATLSIGLNEVPTRGGSNPFAAIVALSPFERFVYVMSILERHSDEDCSRLLRCSKRDVMIARELALRHIAYTYANSNHSREPVQAFWRVCATHYA